MARIAIKLPAMGESVMEASIIEWKKNIGDTIESGDILIEVATDKVDNEIPCEIKGKLLKQSFQKNDVVKVGEIIAYIDDENDSDTVIEENIEQEKNHVETIKEKPTIIPTQASKVSKLIEAAKEEFSNKNSTADYDGERFYSPLIRVMAQEDKIPLSELDTIEGTGENGRFTKSDFIKYINKKNTPIAIETADMAPTVKKTKPPEPTESKKTNSTSEIIPMDRVRKLIANNMQQSLVTSAHVQTFIDVDVTNLVKWRTQIKDKFFDKEKQKLTFTPLFIEVIAKALQDFPLLNSAIINDEIHLKKDINIGMATAMNNGNLIVPVIKNADTLNIVGLAKKVNDLAQRARVGALKSDETAEATYTFTNIGGFGSLMGTPIINQPQVGILALGAIQKTPVVLEDKDGNDYIAIRSKMYLSHSYDHRIIDGAVGGLFVKKVKDYLEQWDINRTI